MDLNRERLGRDAARYRLAAETTKARLGIILDNWPVSQDWLHEELLAAHTDLSFGALSWDRVQRDMEKVAKKKAIRADVAAEPGPPPASWKGKTGFSETQYEVVYRLACGQSLTAISAATSRSVNTVKTHLKSAARKMGCTSGQQPLLVAQALRRQWIPIPEVPVYETCPLSAAQVQTIQYTADGLARDEIAKAMNCPVLTVKSRLDWASRNLGIRYSRNYLVTIALANGWIT